MGLARYFVVARDNQWDVTFEGTRMAACATQDLAVAKASGMANLMGKMGHDADVMLDDGKTLRLVWEYGTDTFPTPAH